MTSHDRLQRIRALNDLCRLGRDPEARIVATRTCLVALGGEGSLAAEAVAQARLLSALKLYAFTEEDGPEGDRGRFELDGETILFRIAYYDRSLDWGSEDPADPAVTRRVLTIMLPEDD